MTDQREREKMDEREIQITEDERAAIEKDLSAALMTHQDPGARLYAELHRTVEHHAIQVARRVIRDNVTQRDEQTDGPPMADDTADKDTVRTERSFGL